MQQLAINHPLYKTWQGMKQRCYNPNLGAYGNYGGRGIKVCKRWLEKKQGFWNFVNDMDEKPSQLYTIDRIDNDKDYSPGNCKWSTRQEQALNRRPRRPVTGPVPDSIQEFAATL